MNCCASRKFNPIAVLGIAVLLLGCSPEPSPQEQERRCADEMRRFHRMEICDFVTSYRQNQFSDPTVEQVVQGANARARSAFDFYPWRSCSKYQEITSADVQSVASDC